MLKKEPAPQVYNLIPKRLKFTHRITNNHLLYRVLQTDPPCTQAGSQT